MWADRFQGRPVEGRLGEAGRHQGGVDTAEAVTGVDRLPRIQAAASSSLRRLRGAFGFLIVTCGSRPATVAMSINASSENRLIFPCTRSDMRGCVMPKSLAAFA